MPKHSKRGVRIYHSIIAILLLLAGGAMLGIGIWLRTTGRDIFKFGIPEDVGAFQDVSFSATLAAIGVGSFLLIAAVASLIGLTRKCIGFTFRFIYVIMALLIVAALIFICVVTTITIRRGSDGGIADFLADGWTSTAATDPQEICRIENTFQCRGFRSRDCAVCKTGLEEDCSQYPDCVKCDTQNNPDVGCYSKMYETLQRILLPIAIVSGILAALVLLDVFLTACL